MTQNVDTERWPGELEAEAWQEEACRYAQNADYWRKRCERAEELLYHLCAGEGAKLKG